MSIKIALLFPGQGSQYIGMGNNLNSELFELANSTLNYDLKKIMLEGPLDQLTLTENTQPAILIHSIALFLKLEKILMEKNLKVDYVLGHSVGEFAALVAAKVLSPNEAIKAVHFRGKYMQEAVPNGLGKMFAILKVSEENILKACKEASIENEEVMAANFNDPSQIVISGHSLACQRAIKWLETHIETPFRAIELQVSAPFHSSLMNSAALKLKELFKTMNWNKNQIPYIANINANIYDTNTDPEIIKENLFLQAKGPVLWTQSILKLPENTLCIEVGPKNVLSGLVKKINGQLKIIALDKEKGFEELNQFLETSCS